MKKYFVLPLVAIVMILAMAGMASCSGNQVEKAVKQAFIDRDTTQARFDSICSIILANPKQYSEYLTPEGEINYAALNELTEQVGSHLRPPMHWNVLAYGAKSL